MPSTKVIPDQMCIYCGYHVNRASSLEGNIRKPREGDISVCVNCGKAMIYGRDLQLRHLTDDERAEINSDPNYLAHRLTWEFWNKHVRKPSR